jgi:3-phosphoshikimate 1-carboxyvinyltransferase
MAAATPRNNRKLDSIMEYLDLGPFSRASGTVRLPGSKSISNRVLLLAALAEGETTITNLLDSDDTRVMLEALEKLGVKLKRDGDVCVVTGTRGAFTAKTADLFLGNAGTAVRPLTAALAVNGGDYRVHGVPRMHERPIGDLVDGLRQIGARIDYEENEGFPPLRIRAGQIAVEAPIRVRGDVSSQFLTALLMTLPLLRTESGSTIVQVEGELISKPYIEITIKLMVSRSSVMAGISSPCPPARVISRRGESWWRAMPPRRRISSLRARWAAGRCGWKGWGARAFRATWALPTR